MKDMFYLRSSASCTSVCGSQSRTGSRTPDAATRRRGAAAQPVADSPPCRRRAADSRPAADGRDGSCTVEWLAALRAASVAHDLHLHAVS